MAFLQPFSKGDAARYITKRLPEPGAAAKARVALVAAVAAVATAAAAEEGALGGAAAVPSGEGQEESAGARHFLDCCAAAVAVAAVAATQELPRWLAELSAEESAVVQELFSRFGWATRSPFLLSMLMEARGAMEKLERPAVEADLYEAYLGSSGGAEVLRAGEALACLMTGRGEWQVRVGDAVAVVLGDLKKEASGARKLLKSLPLRVEDWGDEGSSLSFRHKTLPESTPPGGGWLCSGGRGPFASGSLRCGGASPFSAGDAPACHLQATRTIRAHQLVQTRTT